MKLINSAHFTAVIDANVLFPIVIRDYLIWLSIHGLYTPKWSGKLLEEFTAIFGKKKKDEAQENEVSNVLYEHMCFDITKRVQENGEEQMQRLKRMYQTLSETELKLITQEKTKKKEGSRFLTS